MKKSLFAAAILLAALFSCQKINTARPNCDPSPVVIRQDTSFLSTPLVIPARLIEDKINRAIREDFINDEDFDNLNRFGKKDRLKMKVTRLGEIKVRWKNNLATYSAPLLVLANRQIVPKRLLPGSKSLAIKTEFSCQLVFETALDIDGDWKLIPKSNFKSFEWLSEVTVLGGMFDVKKLVERRILREMPFILHDLDSTIRVSVHLDRPMTRIWCNLQRPVIINRKDQMVWLKIHPIGFEMGKITTESGNLLVQTRLSATTETIVGDTVPFPIDKKLPPLIRRRSLPDSAFVYFLSEVPFADLNGIISKKLSGKTFDLPGHRVVVKNAEIYGCGDHLVLRLSVGGDVKGDIYFNGKPIYEPDSQRIVIQNFDFEVKTAETLLATADWLLHDTFKDQVKTALNVELGEKIETIPAKIMEGIERGRAGKKLDFTIEKWDFRPYKIWVRPDDLAVLILVDARARIELEKL